MKFEIGSIATFGKVIIKQVGNKSNQTEIDANFISRNFLPIHEGMKINITIEEETCCDSYKLFRKQLQFTTTIQFCPFCGVKLI